MREMNNNFNECIHHKRRNKQNLNCEKNMQKKSTYFLVYLLFSLLHFNREIETIYAPYLQRCDSL